MFEAVIFDWDGTLADTKQVIVLSFQKVLQEVGCDVSDEYLERQIGIGARNMFKDALQKFDIPFNEEKIDQLVERKNSIHMELANRIKLFAGVIDLLNSLNDKVKLALASMCSRKVLNKLLRETGIREYFDFVITGDEVQRPKPDSEVFLKCAIQLKCQPEKCVVVEDSIFGVIAAKKAKMKCIAISSGSYTQAELEKADPDLVVKSIKQKQKILNFILI